MIGRVVVPAFDRQRGRRAASSRLIAAVFLGISALRVASIFGRRLGAGVHAVPAAGHATGARVTRRYLALPLAWHQRHATGTLLSNANSDVEAACRSRSRRCRSRSARSCMLVAAVGRRCSLTDWVLALVGVARLPGAVRRSTWSTRGGCRPGRSRGPAAARPRSARSRTRASTARWWSRPWAARPTRPTGSARGAGELRDAMIRGRPAARPVRPADGQRCPASARWPCCWSARGGCGRRDQRRRAGQRRVPVHRAGVPGPRDRLGAGRAAAQRGRLGAGAARCSTRRRRHARTAPAALPARPAPAALASTGVALRVRAAAAPVLHDVAFDGAGRPHRRAGRRRPARASRRSRRWPSGWSTRPPARSRSTASTCASSPRRRWPTTVALVPQVPFVFDDTVRGNVDAGPRRRRRRRRRWSALRLAQADGFVASAADGLDTDGRRAGHLAVRRPAAAADAGPGAGRRPRLLVLDDATSAVDPRVEAAILAALRGQRRRRRRSWSSPTGGPPSRSPTRWSTSSTAGWSRPARTPSCWRPCPGYADLVTAYEQAEAERDSAEREHR